MKMSAKRVATWEADRLPPDFSHRYVHLGRLDLGRLDLWWCFTHVAMRSCSATTSIG